MQKRIIFSRSKPLTIEETQSEKFKQAARDLECYPDETRWEDKLRKVVKQKPLPEKPN